MLTALSKEHRQRWMLVLLAGVAPVLAASSAAIAHDGASVFSQKCSGCHTIGQGTLVGPDLAPCKTWSTPDLTAGIKRMEPMVGTISEQEVEVLVAYLKNSSEKPQSLSDSDAPVPEVSSGSPVEGTTVAGSVMKGSDQADSDPDRGSRLFFGKERFSKGGTQCAACHSMNSAAGMLGGDLGSIGSRMPETALVSACEKTPYKIMRTIYAKHPLSRQEARDVARFLSTPGKAQAPDGPPPVTAYGLAGGVLVLLTAAIGYSQRKGNARDKLRRK